MNDQQKAEAYRQAIEQLEQQRFAKETEIVMIDAQIAALREQIPHLTDFSLQVPGP